MSDSRQDTHNTLKYANRAKNIKTKIVRNVLSVAHHISKYTQIIQDLRAEVTTLKTRLADNDETTVPSRGMDPKGELQVEHKRSEAWKQEVLENFEERIQLRRALLDGENAVRELLVDRGKAQVRYWKRFISVILLKPLQRFRLALSLQISMSALQQIVQGCIRRQ